MGLIGLLFKFTVECFSILAWPLFALGYPLCASIQAIETNSNTDTMKLITYWVCFSLILLFEHAFDRLIVWLSYWPYIKLLIVICLVTPHFEGSYYVYKHLVHPCFSMNPHIVFDWLIKLFELLKQIYLHIDEKREAKEIENPIPFKPKSTQKHINASEITEENEVCATEQVTQMQHDSALSGNITSAPMEIKEMTEASVVGSRDVPEIPPLKNIQKEWTCAVCQITTTCEASLISHLQGKRHKDACDKLKAMNLLSRNRIPPPLETSTYIPDKELLKPGHVLGNRHTEASEKLKAKDQPLESKAPSASAEISASRKSWTCAACKVKTTSKTDLVSHFRGRRHAEGLEKLKAKPNSNSSFEPWTCGLCYLKLKNENDLIKHLEGRRHENACKEFKVPKRTARSQGFESRSC